MSFGFRKMKVEDIKQYGSYCANSGTIKIGDKTDRHAVVIKKQLY
jgi:hypothetical protein